jgi:nucleoside-diphosphate-sugar epimerase
MNGKIVVTGAAGLVGQNLVILLREKGYSVVAIDKNKNNLSVLQEVNPSAKAVLADISKPGDWQIEFEGAKAVVQLQAQIAAKTAELFLRNNVDSVKNVLDTCKEFKIKNLVHISSSVVISKAKDEYTKTKRMGEGLVKHGKVPHTILRPPLMYGCFDAKHLGWLTRFVEKWPIFPVPGSGKYMRQPLYVIDLCKVILSCINKRPANKIHNIIGLERIYYVDLIKKIARAKGLKRLFIPLPISIFGLLMNSYALMTNKPPFTTEQMQALVSGDLFPIEPWCNEFGVSYTPFDEAIKETFSSPYYNYRMKLISPH